MKRMRDFLGREIRKGMWLARSGGGNRYAEYGQILYRVTQSTENRLEIARLRYDKWRTVGRDSGSDWRVGKSLVRKPTKYVIVDPPGDVVRLYDALASGQYTPQQDVAAQKWLAGDEVEF